MPATGFDSIPYDVLKFPPIIVLLQKLFQLIFDTSIIPEVWRKVIIFPILKYPTLIKGYRYTIAV
jgi:hypothetical protein